MAQKKSSEVIPVEESKRWLRRALVRQRQAIPEKERVRLSKRALQSLFRSSDYKKAKVVASFVNFGSELVTDGLTQRAWKDRKKVLIPVTSHGFHDPFFVLFSKKDRLKKTAHGPFELHRKKQRVPFNSIDLVLVPGLGFDQKGRRLGYGGGVYDRILSKTPRAKHVGLFFSAQGLSVLPLAAHDQTMDAIVTENRV